MTVTEPDVRNETRASVVDIAARVTGGEATLVAQRKVRRWIKGITVCGALVRLQAVRIGTTYVTSFEAYERFVAACNSPAPLEA